MLLQIDEALTPADLVVHLDPLEWAQRRRYFEGVPMVVPAPLHEIYLDLSEKVVVEKGAQLGFSEWVINRTLWVADTSHAVRGNALYVLPGGQRAGDFVQARVSPAIENSTYLQSRIRTTEKDPDKVGLRRIGRGYTYFRTSGSRAGMRTVDADMLVLDEFDEMDEWVLPMAEHRLDSSRHPLTVILGTPTYPDVGVDAQYKAGDRRRYEVRCLACDTWQTLDWERSVVVEGDLARADATARLVCIECEADLDETIELAWTTGENGRWTPTNPDALYHSYHLSQLYRPGTNLVAIARRLADPLPEVRREARNQSLGLTFTEEGGKLTEAELRRTAVGPTLARLAAETNTLMGVDIGARHNYVISKMRDGIPHVVFAGEAASFEALDDVMLRWDVRTCVVDANPELHGARAFIDRHPGRAFVCYYTEGRWPATWNDTHNANETAVAENERYRVNVDRTSIMDHVAAIIRGEVSERWGWQPTIALPEDAEAIRGFFAQLTAPERRIEKSERTLKTKAVYDEGSAADHYYHALVYAELARMIHEAGPHVAPWAFS